MSNLEEAIERFHLGDFEYAGGLANHGPMGAEALESLGHQALIPAFLDIYVPRLPPTQSGRVLGEGETEAALGDYARRADWVATYESRLAGGDWRAVVATAVPELVPGIFAAAGHGFLRTAHAVRSLAREDTPLRRRELARGLAHWSCRFQALPGLPGSRPDDQTDVAARLGNLPLLGSEASRQGLFFEAVRALEPFADFARAVDALPLPGAEDLDGFLDDLCRAAAGIYCEHPESRIAYVHAVTLPSALRWLAPLLDPANARLAAGHVFQAVAALHALFGAATPAADPTPDPASDPEVAQTAQDWNEIRYRAACSIQEHAIKMADACWQSYQRVPDPIFALAAADAAIKLEGTRSAGGC